MRKDRRTDTTALIATFRNFAKAPKKFILKIINRLSIVNEWKCDLSMLGLNFYAVFRQTIQNVLNMQCAV
jgi:hypothetical protein